jgi:alpha-amylase/alpha-mannosidase (GH57 family)
MRSVVVHGHFYQPPREDPWTDEVPIEKGAAPFHDWNARIAHECYEPFAAARLLNPAGAVSGMTNLYEWTSFDVGTTLMRWIERHSPVAYRAMLDADRASAARFGGHGNAVAMPYHHVILPLASRRDKVTEVRWGLEDFRRRFGRDAEGMWLPETAMDEETLVVLAEAGVRFTILAPQQVVNAPADGGPLGFDAGGGRSLALFVYNGPLAADAAFGTLLNDGDAMARRMAAPVAGATRAGGDGTLVSLAVDGETFGHHHKFAEMALARAVSKLRADPAVRLENYASVLARMPARVEAELVAPSSWSCPHGIERWRSNCGCRMTAGTSQEWRRPLRAALDWLARMLDARIPSLDAGLGSAAPPPGALRSRFAMFGSCAWFFDDAAGLEVELMLRLAAHAIDLAGDEDIERHFIERLTLAKSNYPAEGDAGKMYVTRIKAVHAALDP